MDIHKEAELGSMNSDNEMEPIGTQRSEGNAEPVLDQQWQGDSPPRTMASMLGLTQGAYVGDNPFLTAYGVISQYG